MKFDFELKKKFERVISGTLASAMALGLLPGAMVPVEATETVEVVEATSIIEETVVVEEVLESSEIFVIEDEISTYSSGLGLGFGNMDDPDPDMPTPIEYNYRNGGFTGLTADSVVRIDTPEHLQQYYTKDEAGLWRHVISVNGVDYTAFCVQFGDGIGGPYPMDAVGSFGSPIYSGYQLSEFPMLPYLDFYYYMVEMSNIYDGNRMANAETMDNTGKHSHKTTKS